MPAIQLLTQDLFDDLIVRARNSPRLRTNHNFHASLDEPVHRLLNVMVKGTYVQPHRHLDPPKAESFLALRGQLALFVFNGSGSVEAVHVLGDGLHGSGCWGVDLAPGIWHTLAVLSEDAVCYEVKTGPYQKLTDKDFAPWAPAEGDPEAGAYLASLVANVPEFPNVGTGAGRGRISSI